jgi:hypothetical protein
MGRLILSLAMEHQVFATFRIAQYEQSQVKQTNPMPSSEVHSSLPVNW